MITWIGILVIIFIDWKLHHYFEDDSLELYNLSTDIGETKNVLNEFPSEAALLQSMLEE